MRLIKGIERHHHAMPVRHGKGDENERERYEDESRDELAQHERSFRSVTETGRLSGPSPSGKPFTRLQAHSKGRRQRQLLRHCCRFGRGSTVEPLTHFLSGFEERH